MRSLLFLPLAAGCALALAACAPTYSPNTYSSNAVQLASKVEAGAVIGYREVAISANGNIGTVTGGAVGGVLGAEYAKSALATVGGSAVGGMLGNALEHAARDTTGWEYIIRKDNGDMLSVTQREKDPLQLGQRVLVIMGPQARVVPDYSVPQEPKVAAAPDAAAQDALAAPRSEPVKVEVVLSLPPGMSARPKEDAAAAAPVAAPAPQAALADALSDAVAVTVPLAGMLMHAPPVIAPGSAAAPEALPEPDAPPGE